MKRGMGMSRRRFLGLSGLATLGAAAGPARAVRKKRRNTVKPGVQVLLEREMDLLRGKRIGIITNPTGVLPDLTSDVDVLASKWRLVAILAPEQGFRGAQQAGESGGGYKDPKTGIMVYEIYGKSPAEILSTLEKAGVEVVLFDLQDVGARFYTYIWTMADTMEAIAGTHLELIVLDRPNPISGVEVEGPVLDPAYSSFVGRYPIAQRHGMTVGELASMFNERFVPTRTGGHKAKLTVVRMEGWRRDMYFEDTGLPWVMPSANMPTVDTAVVYPGTGMIEGTNISEGRGTTRPFELLGAPYIDWRLADAMRDERMAGAGFREAYFIPTFDKYEGRMSGGLQIYVTDRRSFDPIKTALKIMVKTRELYPRGFAWRSDNYIDELTGSAYVRESIDAGKSAEEIVAGWQPALQQFHRLRRRYLLYDEPADRRPRKSPPREASY